jgi:hypothetical protein
VTTIEYQWRRCKADKPDDCADIKEAKAATYTVIPADLGFRLRVRVKVKNKAGDDEDKSFPTAIVSAPPPPSSTPAAPLLPGPAPASLPSPADTATGACSSCGRSRSCVWPAISGVTARGSLSGA